MPANPDNDIYIDYDKENSNLVKKAVEILKSIVS
jgi:hypothetical protein